MPDFSIAEWTSCTCDGLGNTVIRISLNCGLAREGPALINTGNGNEMIFFRGLALCIMYNHDKAGKPAPT